MGPGRDPHGGTGQEGQRTPYEGGRERGTGVKGHCLLHGGSPVPPALPSSWSPVPLPCPSQSLVSPALHSHGGPVSPGSDHSVVVCFPFTCPSMEDLLCPSQPLTHRNLRVICSGPSSLHLSCLQATCLLSAPKAHGTLLICVCKAHLRYCGRDNLRADKCIIISPWDCLPETVSILCALCKTVVK